MYKCPWLLLFFFKLTLLLGKGVLGSWGRGGEACKRTITQWHHTEEGRAKFVLWVRVSKLVHGLGGLKTLPWVRLVLLGAGNTCYTTEITLQMGGQQQMMVWKESVWSGCCSFKTPNHADKDKALTRVSTWPCNKLMSKLATLSSPSSSWDGIEGCGWPLNVQTTSNTCSGSVPLKMTTHWKSMVPLAPTFDPVNTGAVSRRGKRSVESG